MKNEPPEWAAPVPQEIVDSLWQSIRQGPLLSQDEIAALQRQGVRANPGTRHLLEQLVANYNALRIEIRAREHPPPHFHVLYAGEENSYSIESGLPLYTSGLRKWHATIKEWHGRNKGKLIQVWNETRPANCPVGPIEIEPFE